MMKLRVCRNLHRRSHSQRSNLKPSLNLQHRYQSEKAAQKWGAITPVLAEAEKNIKNAAVGNKLFYER